MSKRDWFLWVVPVAVWCLYASWHFGYQLGYAEGHTSAWNRYRPDAALPQLSDFEVRNATSSELISK